MSWFFHSHQSSESYWNSCRILPKRISFVIYYWVPFHVHTSHVSLVIWCSSQNKTTGRSLPADYYTKLKAIIAANAYMKKQHKAGFSCTVHTSHKLCLWFLWVTNRNTWTRALISYLAQSEAKHSASAFMKSQLKSSGKMLKWYGCKLDLSELSQHPDWDPIRLP